MNDNQRLQLQNMIKANNTEDYTDTIRELNHSEIIRNDVKNLLFLKKKYNNDEATVHVEAVSECNFLFTYYTDIYNKLRKDELDVEILFRFLDVLKQIENAELDQHEGSFIVGTILKELYIDSELKKANKLNNDQNIVEPKKVEKDISWSDYKKMMS